MKNKLLISSCILFTVCLIIFNITTIFENKVVPNITLDQILVLAREMGIPENENNQELKTIACADGKGYRKKCEFEPNAMACSFFDETHCESGNDDTGQANGETKICQQQGHNMVTQGGFQSCTRCQYSNEIHRHNWRFTSTQKMGNIIMRYVWKCDGCGRMEYTSTYNAPSRDN